MAMKVTCAGILVADIVRRFSKRAEPGKLVTLSEPITLHVGGCAANTAISLAKMGCQANVVGAIGPDYWGRFLIESLRGYPGINVDGVVVKEGAVTSTTDIEVDMETGERTFYHYVGANSSFLPSDISEWCFDCDVFHIGGYNLIPSITASDLKEIFRRAHAHGAKTSVDLAWSDRANWTELLSAMDEIDLYFSNLDEARMVVGSPSAPPKEVSRRIKDLGPQVVAVKMGPNGCHVRTEDEIVDMPADPRFKAVDGTGAGDAFVAGFILGLGEGWEISKVTRFANTVGGFCVSKPGATDGVPDRRTVLDFIEKNPPEFSNLPAYEE